MLADIFFVGGGYEKCFDRMKYYVSIYYMSKVIRISESLAEDAKIRSTVEHWSLSAQVAYRAVIGKAVEENTDLPYSFIKEILLGVEEMKQKGKEEYVFG